MFKFYEKRIRKYLKPTLIKPDFNSVISYGESCISQSITPPILNHPKKKRTVLCKNTFTITHQSIHLEMQERPHSSQDWGIQPPPLTSAMFVWSVQPSRAQSRWGQWKKWQRHVQIQIQKAAGLHTSEYHLGKVHKVNTTPRNEISLYQFLQLHTEHLVAHYENLLSVIFVR